MTPAEVVFWGQLWRSAREVERFRRQAIVAGFIADFYCPALRLVVEIDGSVHELKRAHDQRRDQIMQRRGLLVIRVTNDEVLLAPRETLLRIVRQARATLASRKPGGDPAGGVSGRPPYPPASRGDRG